MRKYAEVAIATGISPVDLLALGDDWVETLTEVVNKANKKR